MSEVNGIAFACPIIFYVIRIMLTTVFGVWMIRRAWLNHFNDHAWKLALLATGLFFLTDSLNDVFWVWHFAHSSIMQENYRFLWALIPATLAAFSAIFMAFSFWRRAEFFRDLLNSKQQPVHKHDNK